jgi:hypothetical protein
MDEQNLSELKAARSQLVSRRHEAIKSLCSRTESWTELREICRQIFEIDRALDLVPATRAGLQPPNHQTAAR